MRRDLLSPGPPNLYIRERPLSRGSVGIYSTSGKLLLEVNRGSAKAAALSGNSLAVLTTSNRVELYRAKTGSLVRSRRVPAGAAHLDLQAGIAIYSVYPLNGRVGPRKLHVLQLKTGKDVVLASGEAALSVHAGRRCADRPARGRVRGQHQGSRQARLRADGSRPRGRL